MLNEPREEPPYIPMAKVRGFTAEFGKQFLENLLHIPIERIEFARKQEDLSDDYIGHGIRLDVYAGDSQGTVYNVEVQTSNEGNLERRARFYQGGIDRRLIEKGEDYEKLPNSYVIFVCSFDYYGEGLPVYEKTCFISPYVKYRQYIDGSHVFILNSHYDRNGEYTRDCASPEILEFLDILETHEDVDVNTLKHDFTKSVVRSVHNVRTDRTKEVPYMTWARSIQDAMSMGETKRSEAMAVKMLKSNILTVEQIADFSELPVEEVLTLKAKIDKE